MRPLLPGISAEAGIKALGEDVGFRVSSVGTVFQGVGGDVAGARDVFIRRKPGVRTRVCSLCLSLKRVSAGGLRVTLISFFVLFSFSERLIVNICSCFLV